MVAGLRRAASTIRSRSSPSDQRAPVPFRLGARLPWKRCSGNGPEWHSRQAICALDHDGPAPLGVARRAGQRLRNGVADNLVGTQRFLRLRRAAERNGEDEEREALHPNTSPVMARYQASASSASALRVARGASAG